VLPPSPITAALADRYAVERELGRGGMATVYLAEEKKHGRKVAIKVLRPEITAALGTERFLREIGIAARLAHPHIVPLIDSGEAGGLLYYVQPHVPGGSLRDRLLEHSQLAVKDALRIAQEIGAGLDFAHRKGFVHRDVKPENILFADGHAVLADFGVARACCDAEDGVTEVGLAVGTPEYMSPEQASGDEELSAASDVYSLACVVYEMLAGEPPFRGNSSRAVMAQHVTAAPRPLRGFRPDVPAGTERAIARGLEKDPAQRYPSAAEFVAALAAPDGVARSPAATRSIAVLPFVNASPDADNEYLSDGITDELIDALAKISGLRVSSRTSVFALKGKPLDVRAVGALLGTSVVLEGTVRKAGDRLRITAQLTSTDDGRLLWSQRYDRQLVDVFAIQDEIAATIVNTLRATMFADVSEHVARRYTENIQAYGLYLKGRYEWNKRTQEGVAAAIHYFERAIAEDPAYAPAYAGLSDSYSLDVDYRSIPVHEAYQRAKDYARKALALDESVPTAHASLAWALFIYDWQWDEAEREFRRAIELNPRYASAHQWFAFLLAARGQHDAALVEGHTALELDPASVSIRRAVGWLYYYARRFDQAREHLARAIEMNPTAVESYRMLGSTLALQGDGAEAERVLREALTLEGAAAYSKATLGWLLARSGRREDAVALLWELDAARAQGYVSPVAFAILHIGLGNLSQALDWSERAYDERRGWLAYVNVNPMFDPLRNEPRYAALVKRMRL
ncbi:MAG TPA: protein kinase, partial [Gemmatimonadales bacterium]|nr:protein kinase [Gemmatimonadales bacterium]